MIEKQSTGRAPAQTNTAVRVLVDAGRITLKLVALFVLVIYMPILIVIALAVVFTSPGPAFINRCYRRPNGQTVELWEFRTECWERWQPTTVGRYLRGSNMHRLPALINVLRGDVAAGERVRAAAD